MLDATEYEAAAMQAYELIASTSAEFCLARDYRNGRAKPRYVSERGRKINRNVGHWSINIVRPAIDAYVDRFQLEDIQTADQSALAILDKLWGTERLQHFNQTVIDKTAEYGVEYVLIETDINGVPQVYPCDPMTTVAIYEDNDEENPYYAARVYRLEDKTIQVVLYDELNIVTMQSTIENPQKQADWKLINEYKHDYGFCPIDRCTRSDMQSFGKPAWQGQDMIDKILSVAMINQEYAGSPTLVALMDDTSVSTDIDGTSKLVTGSNQVWELEGVKQFLQLDIASSDSQINMLNEITNRTAVACGVPLHTLNSNGQVPSGEALRRAEAPLVKQVKNDQILYSAFFRRLYARLLELLGYDNSSITIRWADPSVQSELSVQDKLDMGITRTQLLREAGFSDQIILAQFGLDSEYEITLNKANDLMPILKQLTEAVQATALTAEQAQSIISKLVT